MRGSGGLTWVASAVVHAETHAEYSRFIRLKMYNPEPAYEMGVAALWLTSRQGQFIRSAGLLGLRQSVVVIVCFLLLSVEGRLSIFVAWLHRGSSSLNAWVRAAIARSSHLYMGG